MVGVRLERVCEQPSSPDPRRLPAVVERNGAPAMDPNDLGGEVCADARKGKRRWAKKM